MCRPCRKILTICSISMLLQDVRKCHVFSFLKINWTRQGLILAGVWCRPLPELTHLPQGDMAVIVRVISKVEHMLQIKFICISCEIATRWMPQNTFDAKSTLVQEMAQCHQATSHYLRQYWLRSTLTYGVTRPHWVNLTAMVNLYSILWPRN